MFDDLIGISHKSIGQCAGLASEACSRLGIDLPEWGEICVSQAEAEIENRKGLFQAIDTPEIGDLVHVRSMNNLHHVGVVVGKNEMLQSTERHGVHKIRLDHPWLSNRIIGYYRYVA